MGRLLDEVNRMYQAACRLQAVEYEITHRCPCACPHCYLTAPIGEELDSGEVDRLFAALREEGVLDLAITGGEPLLREDLPAVLELAHRERFQTSLLTTGVLVGPAEARLLARADVRVVEMSLLGASAATHDRLMKHPGALDKTLRAARLLRDAGIEVALKATALTANYREVPGMRALAQTVGARFSVNALVAPGIDGDPAPQRFMLDASRTAEAGLDPAATAGLTAGEAGQGAVLTCQAGRTIAAITPDGQVLPCVAFRRPVGSLRERSLQEVWNGDPDPFLLRLRALRPEEVTECRECPSRARCRRCPGVAFSETGELGTRSPSACLLAGRENVGSSQGS